MQRTVPVLLILLMLTASASALSFTIRDSSCTASETTLFSMSNLTNAHAGAPGTFEDESDPTYGINGRIVCGQDTGDVRIAETCENIENRILSLQAPEQGWSHLSTDGRENDHRLCADRLATSVWRQCPSNAEPIVSIHGPIQSHIAEPGHYGWQICGALFRNATLAYNFTMSGNTTFVNNEGSGAAGETLSGGSSPLYAAVQNQSLISGIVGDSADSQSVTIRNRSGRAQIVHSMSDGGTSTWFIPLAMGNQFDIQSRLSLIQSGTFLTQFNPNFALTLAEEALIRIGLSFTEIDLVNSLDVSQGTYTFNVEKTGEVNGTPQVNISVQ